MAYNVCILGKGISKSISESRGYGQEAMVAMKAPGLYITSLPDMVKIGKNLKRTGEEKVFALDLGRVSYFNKTMKGTPGIAGA